MPGLPFEQVKRAAMAVLPTLLARWLPNGMARGRNWVARHKRRADDMSSLVVWLRSGAWKRYSTGEGGGDPISLYAYLFGLDQGAACRELAAELGIEAGAPRPGRVVQPDPEPEPAREPAIDADKEAADRRRWARAIWQEAKPAAGTLVETYLASRAITVPPPPTIRFDRLAHPATGKETRWPVMVAAMQVGKRISGVHRTFLDQDGQGKAVIYDHRGVTGRKAAPRAETKLMLGQADGAVVRLSPTSPCLAICEGIETGLSLVQIAPEWAVWAALSAGNLARVAIPEGVREVVFFADGDRKDDLKRLGIRRVGLEAAQAAANALEGLGLRARVLVGPPGTDANDLLLQRSPLLGQVAGLMRGWMIERKAA